MANASKNQRIGGLMAGITNPPTKDNPFDLMKSLQDYWDCKQEAERKEIEEQKRFKAIWNKHYRKYGLEYRE